MTRMNIFKNLSLSFIFKSKRSEPQVLTFICAITQNRPDISINPSKWELLEWLSRSMCPDAFRNRRPLPWCDPLSALCVENSTLQDAMIGWPQMPIISIRTASYLMAFSYPSQMKVCYVLSDTASHLMIIKTFLRWPYPVGHQNHPYTFLFGLSSRTLWTFLGSCRIILLWPSSWVTCVIPSLSFCIKGTPCSLWQGVQHSSYSMTSVRFHKDKHQPVTFCWVWWALAWEPRCPVGQSLAGSGSWYSCSYTVRGFSSSSYPFSSCQDRAAQLGDIHKFVATFSSWCHHKLITTSDSWSMSHTLQPFCHDF